MASIKGLNGSYSRRPLHIFAVIGIIDKVEKVELCRTSKHNGSPRLLCLFWIANDGINGVGEAV